MNDSNIQKTQQLKLYSTAAHPCSYLEDREAITLFVDPEAKIDRLAFTYLAERGFWRSGAYLFKPDCINCQACIPIRIPLDRYQMSSNEKRCLRKNNDITINISTHLDGDKLYPLYQKYINKRHISGDMYPANREQFDNFLSTYINSSKLVSFYRNDILVCASIMDELTDGYMAIYTFFDPDIKGRSLGHFAILWQIVFATMQMKEFLYLGYWVKQCQKMAYKTRYKPCEIRIDDRWIDLI